MRFRRLLFAVLLIAVVLFFSRDFFRREPETQIKLSSTEEEPPASGMEQMRSFTISGYTESGQKKWQVEGKSADIMSEVINISDVTANAYGDDMAVKLTSDEGVFDKKKNDIELKKNVIAVTSDATTLTTETLRWNAKDETIDNDEHVLIERSDMDIEGVGLLAKPNLRRAQLNRDVKVDMKDPEALITCDGPLEVDYENNIAYFNNNVELDDSKVQIYADKAWAYFDPKQKLLTKVYAEGNVKIIRGENITYTEEMTYLPDEGRVILTGRPKIIIHDTEEILKKSEEKQEDGAVKGTGSGKKL